MTAGQQARELTTGQLLGTEEVSEVVFAAHTEFITATATFFIDTSCLNVL